MLYLQLFLSLLQIVLFSFGGGYASLPLIQEQVVTQHQWLTMSEFTDLITISQMTPGPTAVNSATFVGIKIAGIGGALCATAGCILPSCIIVTLLAKLYFKYRNLTVMSDVLSALRPAVVAMIAAAGVAGLVSAFWGERINIQATQWVLVAAFAVCFVLLRKTKLNPVWVMVIAGVINTAYTLISSAVTS